MQALIRILFWWLAVVLALPAAAQEHRLLVLPIFGLVPPEMELPSSAAIAESLALELEGRGLEVHAEQPAGRVVPEDLEGAVRDRAREIDAQGAVWGELRPPGSCRAPRLVRIRILDVNSNIILDRDLCPSETGIDVLARAIALATANALRSGLVESLKLIDDAESAADLAAAIPDKSVCPECSACPPCPPQKECPEPRPCPQPPPCPEPPRPDFRVAAGFLFTSHPRWQSYGLGAALEISWTPLTWLETGLGLYAGRGRRIGVTDVQGLYSSWPVSVWARGILGDDRLEGTLDLGFVAAWSRLDALLERFEDSIRVDRFNPGVFARLGLRWWIGRLLGIHFTVGSTLFVRRQRYSYSYLGLDVEVLSLDPWSLDCAVFLVVPFG